MTPGDVLTETDIQRQILDYLDRAGIMAWRNNTGRRGGVSYGAKGSPDILGVLPGGRALGIEVKRPGKEATRDQRIWGARMSLAGGKWFVAHSFDEMRQWMRQPDTITVEVHAIADTQAAMTAEEE